MTGPCAGPARPPAADAPSRRGVSNSASSAACRGTADPSPYVATRARSTTVVRMTLGTWHIGDVDGRRTGFGTKRLTGDRDQVVALLRRAVELGANHIDTATFSPSDSAPDEGLTGCARRAGRTRCCARRCRRTPTTCSSRPRSGRPPTAWRVPGVDFGRVNDDLLPRRCGTASDCRPPRGPRPPVHTPLTPYGEGSVVPRHAAHEPDLVTPRRYESKPRPRRSRVRSQRFCLPWLRSARAMDQRVSWTPV